MLRDKTIRDATPFLAPLQDQNRLHQLRAGEITVALPGLGRVSRLVLDGDAELIHYDLEGMTYVERIKEDGLRLDFLLCLELWDSTLIIRRSLELSAAYTWLAASDRATATRPCLSIRGACMTCCNILSEKHTRPSRMNDEMSRGEAKLLSSDSSTLDLSITSARRVTYNFSRKMTGRIVCDTADTRWQPRPKDGCSFPETESPYPAEPPRDQLQEGGCCECEIDVSPVFLRE